MNSGGGDAPPPSLPVNGGEFLLQLLRKPPNPHPPTPLPQQPSQTISLDPAVAAMGPTVPTLASPQSNFPSNSVDHPYSPWGNSHPPLFAPHNFFTQNPNTNPILNPDVSSPTGGLSYASNQYGVQFNHASPGENFRTLGYLKDNPKASPAHQQVQNLIFGSLNRDIRRNEAAVEGNVLHEGLGQRGKFRNPHSDEGLGMDGRLNGFQNPGEINGNSRGNSSEWRGFEQERSRIDNNRGRQNHNGIYRAVVPTPPGFSSKIKNVGNRECGNRRTFDHNADKGKVDYSEFDKNYRLSNHPDTPGFQAGRNILAVSISDNEESVLELHGEDGDNGVELGHGRQNKTSRDHRRSELDDLEDQLVGSLGLGDESDEKSDKKKHHRDKDYRSDKRGQWILGQRMRNLKRQTACRSDLRRFNAPFLAVYDSLIPADEEKVKQKQLLTVLEKLVINEWPEARLFLYGSCANSFGFSKSDLDVCLVLKDENIDKCEILLKLADILESNNFQNVQALTRARVPIVKLMDPDTGISCDICVNNVLAVVNTKLLRDYAQIDVRLLQLAFIVKHWAKSRGVNETYQGTLSSYAYVLMCINFLQQRRPAILPCLQGMNITYYATVDNVECAYFDKVEKLANFGSRNGESIAQLVWAFFYYWAYCHDYANDVISVRLGITVSKRAKDWTRRVGNDRHLICIEDPFEVSHDLGRVVDKYSIRVLREEFERAAEIMQYDSNPCATLFEPYVPN